jgi:hypothetical protein
MSSRFRAGKGIRVGSGPTALKRADDQFNVEARPFREAP